MDKFENNNNEKNDDKKNVFSVIVVVVVSYNFIFHNRNWFIIVCMCMCAISSCIDNKKQAAYIRKIAIQSRKQLF